MEYLISTKRPKIHHLWDGEDTACRMYSTGGLLKSLYKVFDSTNSLPLCNNCLNHSARMFNSDNPKLVKERIASLELEIESLLAQADKKIAQQDKLKLLLHPSLENRVKDKTIPDHTEIYTDGSCLKNPGGAGGWGAVVVKNSAVIEIHKGGSHSTTNNIMELVAALEGLLRIEPQDHVKIYSDSQYVIKGMTEWYPGWVRRGWKTAEYEPVKNSEIWKQLLDAVKKHKRVEWIWIKAHAGHHLNEMADNVAGEQAKEYRKHR